MAASIDLLESSLLQHTRALAHCSSSFILYNNGDRAQKRTLERICYSTSTDLTSWILSHFALIAIPSISAVLPRLPQHGMLLLLLLLESQSRRRCAACWRIVAIRSRAASRGIRAPLPCKVRCTLSPVLLLLRVSERLLVLLLSLLELLKRVGRGTGRSIRRLWRSLRLAVLPYTRSRAVAMLLLLLWLRVRV